MSKSESSPLQQQTPTQRPAHHHGRQPPLDQRRHLPDSSPVGQRSAYSKHIRVKKNSLHEEIESVVSIFVFSQCRIWLKDKIPLTLFPKWASPFLQPAASTPPWSVFRLPLLPVALLLFCLCTVSRCYDCRCHLGPFHPLLMYTDSWPGYKTVIRKRKSGED